MFKKNPKKIEMGSENAAPCRDALVHLEHVLHRRLEVSRRVVALADVALVRGAVGGRHHGVGWFQRQPPPKQKEERIVV